MPVLLDPENPDSAGAVRSVTTPPKSLRLLDRLLLGDVLASWLVFYYVITHGTWDPLFEQPQHSSRFFFAQARSITAGKLSVPPSQLLNECFVHAHKCYGYFGITPSLVRIPFLPLLDHFHRSFTPIFLASALTLAAGSMIATLRHLLSDVSLSRTTTIMVAMIGLGLGPASVLMFEAQPAVYQEAIAWAVGLISLSIYCFVRWWETQRQPWSVLILVSLVLAANARPTAVPFALVVGVGMGYRVWSSPTRTGPRKGLLLSTAVVVLPLLTCAGVFYLKFGQVDPSLLLHQQIGGKHPSPVWVAIRTIDHDHFYRLQFLPTTLIAYLRPDAIAFSRAFPWVSYRFGGTYHSIAYVGLRPGSLYVEAVSSIIDTMPLAVLAVGCLGAFHLPRGNRALPPALWKPILLLAGVASWAFVLVYVDIANRYLGDLYPLLGVIVVLAAVEVAKRIGSGRRLVNITTTAIVTVGVCWQLLVGMALEYHQWW